MSKENLDRLETIYTNIGALLHEQGHHTAIAQNIQKKVDQLRKEAVEISKTFVKNEAPQEKKEE